MATNLILTKESSESEIRAYFNAILELSKSDNEFPVNLEEVWMLVYPRKDHAVRELKEKFIQQIDYQTFPKNGEQDSETKWGGNNRIDYYLTIPCLEFFIARKVRAVFEVYRQVFHYSINTIKNRFDNESALQQQLSAANEKIYSLTAELNFLRGRMEAEKELGALRATIEAEKRIAVLEYRLLKEEKQSLVSQKPKEPVRREIKKRTTEGLFDTPIPKNVITEPDYARSCNMQNKKEVEKCYPGAMIVSEMSRRIKEECGIYIKSGEIFSWLRTNGFLSSDKENFHKPSDECMKNRWIVHIRAGKTEKETGIRRSVPYITPRGYDHFKQLLLPKGGNER